MEDQFNGDYDKLMGAYKSLQSEYTSTKQSQADLTSQMQALSDKVNQLSAPPAAPPTPAASTGGGSLYDWHNEELRTADGAINPNLISAMKQAGADESVVQNIVKTVEDARAMAAHQKQWAITSTVGNEENMNKLLEWSQTQTDNSQLKVANHFLSDVRTMHDGLNILKDQAAAAGYDYSSPNPNTPASNEPSPLPQTVTGAGHAGMTPLIPGSADAAQAAKEAAQSGDPAQIEQVKERLAMGMKRS